MKKHRIVRKLKKEYKALKRSTRLLDGSCKAALIHQLRLGYKRIDALLTMLVFQKWAKDLHIPVKLKEVYKYSGTLRKLQLQLALFSPPRNKYAAQYLKTLRSAMKDAKQQFKKRLSTKLIETCRNKNVAAVKGRFSAEDYHKFLVAKSKRIDKTVHIGAITDHKLHIIRKELKDVLYTKQLFKGAFRTDRRLYRMYEISSGRLLQRLGRFQDQCNAIDLLQPGRYPGLGRKVGRWMKEQRQRLRTRKAKMKRRLSKELKQKF